MDGESSSPYTPDQEPFLSSAAGMKKPVIDDITMSSLPGTPMAASTVIRQRGDVKERAAVNGTDSRGSLFGSNDPSLSQSRSRSKDSPYFMMNPENTIEESPLEGPSEGEGNQELSQESARGVQDFLKTQDVSRMLQQIPFSQPPLPDRSQSRTSLVSQTSDTSLGILSLDSMQDSDMVGGLANYDSNFEQGTAASNASQNMMMNGVSEKGKKDAVNHHLKGVPQPGEYDDSPLSRGQGSFGAQRLSEAFDRSGQDASQFNQQNRYPLQHSTSAQAMGSSNRDHFMGDTARDTSHRTTTDEGGTNMSRRNNSKPGETVSVNRYQRRTDDASGGNRGMEEGHQPRQQDKDKRPAAVDPAQKVAQRAQPGSQGFDLMAPGDEEEEHQIDEESLQAGLEELDAIFFDPSPTSNSQRSGSGDGEESHSSSLVQSPRSTHREDPRVHGTTSQMSAMSLDFGEAEDQGNFLQDAFGDDARESEIDTEDEIEAARRESELVPALTGMDDIVRPGIEGGSSGEEDRTPLTGNTLEPRQSAEGVVTTSPVPGDGGGGGDGMSDGGSDSGASVGERSPVRNGVNGSDLGDEEEQAWQDGGAFSVDMNVEGLTRFQPVGDGIMDDTAAAGRQVRFASHDDVTRWTPSGSAFHSRLRRPRKSEAESGNESLFPLTAHQVHDSPPVSMQLFLQPTHPPSSGQGAAAMGSVSDWSQQGDSLVFSQSASLISQQAAPPGESTMRDYERTLTPALPGESAMRGFERTLTPGASSSQDPVGARECSLGTFGMAPAEGGADITFSQRVSFGEDFSLLEAVGGSGSDTSSKRSSVEDTRGKARGPASGQSSRRSKGTVYTDNDGRGVTDLAFRYSLPIVHKLGAVNPSESFDEQNKIEQDIMREIDFGIDEDGEEFLADSGKAAALLNADESQFMEENIFRQDEHMSPGEASDFSNINASHMTIQENITGQEDFCRISLGTFFGARTHALGSLSGETGYPRPSFGMQNVISPPAREPAAIYVDSNQSSRVEVPGEQAPPPYGRQDGEGGTTKGDEGSSLADTEADMDNRANPSKVAASGGISGKAAQIDSDEGRATPPLNLSDIVHIIGTISSQCDSEEICEKLLAFSDELHRPTQDEPKGKEATVDENRESGARKRSRQVVDSSSDIRPKEPYKDKGSQPQNQDQDTADKTRLVGSERSTASGSKGIRRSKGSGRSLGAPSGQVSRVDKPPSDRTLGLDGSRVSDGLRGTKEQTYPRMYSRDSGLGSAQPSRKGSEVGGNKSTRSVGAPQKVKAPSRRAVTTSSSDIRKARSKARGSKQEQQPSRPRQGRSQIKSHRPSTQGEKHQVIRHRQVDAGGGKGGRTADAVRLMEAAPTGADEDGGAAEMEPEIFHDVGQRETVGRPGAPGGVDNESAGRPRAPGGVGNESAGRLRAPGGVDNESAGRPRAPGGVGNESAERLRAPGGVGNESAGRLKASGGVDNESAGRLVGPRNHHEVGRENQAPARPSELGAPHGRPRESEARSLMLRESLEDSRQHSWATSSSLNVDSVSPRGFFKTARRAEWELPRPSQKLYEVKERQSIGGEEEISPILEKEMDLKVGGDTQASQPIALLREESEPDGEPNCAGTVGNVPNISQPSRIPVSQSNTLSQTRTSCETSSSQVSKSGPEATHQSIYSSAMINSPVTSKSRTSLNRKERILTAGKHEITLLSKSQLVHSLSDSTIQLSNDHSESPRAAPVPGSPNHSRVVSSKERVSSSGISSSSLSSEDERARSSVSPPPAKPPARPVVRNAFSNIDIESDVALHPRLKIDGEESHCGKVVPMPPSHPSIIPGYCSSHDSLPSSGRNGPTPAIGQMYQEGMNMHTSASLPTLLTSQSLGDRHSPSRVIHSRTGSSLSQEFVDPRLSNQSIDSLQTSHGTYPSQGYLGETFSNLGRRPAETHRNLEPSHFHGPSFPLSQDQLRQTHPSVPSYQGYWTQGPHLQGLHHGALPSYGHEVPLQRTAGPQLDLRQHPPIMSLGAIPGGMVHPGAPHASYGGTQLLSGTAPPLDPHHTGYYTTASSHHRDQHSGTFPMDRGLPSDYHRGTTCQLVYPAQVRFEGVCCVGIASHTSLPMRNTSGRWLHCLINIELVTANGEKVGADSSFIVKQHTNIAPHATEYIRVLFIPKHPGIYTALMHIRWSMVVPDTNREPPQLPPQVVTIQALAESPSVEVLEGKELHLGEMVYGSSRSKALHIINRGRCTVPVRMLVTSSSSSLNCFSVSTGEKKSDTVSVSPRGTHTSISPLHVSLKGCPASDSDEDFALAVTVWVHFKAPPKAEFKAMQRAETLSAQLHIEMDVPEKVMTLYAVNLQSKVGVANLHVSRKTMVLNFSACVGKKDSHKLPLKNSGTIMLTIAFSVSRAEDLFGISPETLTLQPGEDDSVMITYAPKQAPSAVESLLTMKTKEDGQEYDVTLRGEGTIEEQSSGKEMPTLFSNKQFLSWGGVAVGRALQQKIVLRNSSSTLPLKLKLTITGSTDFQLQSSFGSQIQLTDTKSLILKPEEDFPVHILYAPTTVAVSQGLLVMKPVGGCTKYTVPLSGYGGVSSLSLEGLETVGETTVLPVGVVTVGQRQTYTLRVSNNGDRAAFAKVLCFSDLTARIKLPKTHLSVQPHEFVLQPSAVQELTVIYQPTEKDCALCFSNSSMVAVVGLFSGDEIMRQQLMKSLRLGQARQFEMSTSNPLRGVIFDKTFLNESGHRSEPSLPSRPNDIQLFYSCMSRLMMALVGDASTGSPLDASTMSAILRREAAVSSGDVTLPENTSRSSRPASSPPVKGTPASHERANHGDPSTGTTGSWTLRPEHLILTASTSGSKSDTCGRIYLDNLTQRKLSFELTWPGHILTVNPHNGVVQPNEKQMLLVSANPSIHSRGVQLPWVGSLRVSCDNTEKEVRVQVRQDLAQDTSILQASSKKLHSLSTHLATPDITPTSTPSGPTQAAAVSPKELKVRSKVITCEEVCVGQSSDYIFEFENTKKYPMNWSLVSFAPAYLRQSDGTVCRTTYAVFRFETTKGKMTPGQKMQLTLHFTPREGGDYSQFWDLESSSTQNLVSHKTRIELSGRGLQQNPKRTSRQGEKPVDHNQAKTRGLPQSQGPDPIRSSDKGKSSAAGTVHTSRSKQPSKKPAIVVNESVSFERTEVNKSQQVIVRLKNCSNVAQKLEFTSPRKPFSISHHEHVIKSRHYLKLPVTFHPTTKGRFESPLVIQTESQENLVVRLMGECI